MQENIDNRGVLEDNIFSYRISKDNRVFVFWHGKQVKILKGAVALSFIEDIKASDEKEAQLIMAKATGNFKRGNERLVKYHK